MIKNSLKLMYCGFLMLSGSILGFAGPSSASYQEEPEEEQEEVSLKLGPSAFPSALKHAIKTGQSCAHNETYKECWECCEKLGVEEDYMETCVAICEDIKLRKLRGY